MKKNILFISPTGTLDNGAEISIFHLMKYLVQDGYHVINAIFLLLQKKELEPLLCHP